MRRLSALGCLVALSCGCACAAAAQQSTPAPIIRRPPDGPAVQIEPRALEILSDTQGVDFEPYVQVILKQIYREWMKRMPPEARNSTAKQGVTEIRFTINPDGSLAAMHLDGSAQDNALDRAAWGSITGVGQFPALPKEFHGPNLQLRIHFRVNS